MKILVTGATGQLGSLVMEALLKAMPAERLAASVRDPHKAASLKARGVDVRAGDFDRPETLPQAFAGVDRILIISTMGDNATRIRQHLNAVAAAKEAGVRFIAYTSVAKADQSRLPLAEVHRTTEEAIRETGIPFSFLRNNWYLENDLGTIQAVLGGAPWVTNLAKGRIGYALRRDYAEAAAAVLTGDGHENTVYELSGKPVTQDEVVAELSAVLGRTVTIQHVDDETYAATLRRAGMPEPVVSMTVSMNQAIRDGALDVESRDLEQLLRRPPTGLREGLQALVARLSR